MAERKDARVYWYPTKRGKKKRILTKKLTWVAKKNNNDGSHFPFSHLFRRRRVEKIAQLKKEMLTCLYVSSFCHRKIDKIRLFVDLFGDFLFDDDLHSRKEQCLGAFRIVGSVGRILS